jgi:hypothetical protein
MNILDKHGIIFDEQRHAYTSSAGFAIPSVTQILPFKCDGPEDVIRKAAERGHRVHKWIEEYESGHHGASYLFDDQGYINAWLRFKEVTGFELARFDHATYVVADVGSARLPTGDIDPMVERFVYHKDYGYVGRLDLIGYLRRIPKIENDLTLVDAKTVAKLYPTTALQTAAYQQAINQELKALGLPLVKHRWAAQLKPDGTCRRASYDDDKGDFSTFLAYLNVTRWETLHGEILPDDPFTAPAQRDAEEVMSRL